MIDKEFQKIKDEWFSKIMFKLGEASAEIFLRQLDVLEAVVKAEIEKLKQSISSLKEENSIIRDLIGAKDVEIKSKLISQSEQIRFLEEQLLDFKKQISLKSEEIEKKQFEIEILKRNRGIFEEAHNKEVKRLQSVIEDIEKKLQELDNSWTNKYNEVLKELTAQRRIYQNKLNLASIEIWKFSYSVFSGWITYIREQLGAVFGAVEFIHSSLSATFRSTKKIRKEVEPDLVLIKDRTTKVVESFNKMAEFFSVQPEFKLSDINNVVKRLQNQFQRFYGITINWPSEKEYPKVVMDEELILEALLEVIKNSIESLGEETRSGAIDFNINTDENRGLVIEFSDNGPGVPQENQEKLFTPFFTTKSKHDGLGLVKAKRNVLFHGGQISFEQLDGRPLFRIRLNYE